MDREALELYLQCQYIPAPWTIYKQIRKLPPAHLLTVERDGRHDLRPYWQLRMAPKRRLSATAARERLLELLDEATRLRMVSDVPLGALLSGGVDSSAVVASMCAARSAGEEPVKTFTIGFALQTHDGEEQARKKLEAIVRSFPAEDARPKYDPTPPQPWDKKPD